LVVALGLDLIGYELDCILKTKQGDLEVDVSIKIPPSRWVGWVSQKASSLLQ
jgi:hypothetical protein